MGVDARSRPGLRPIGHADDQAHVGATALRARQQPPSQRRSVASVRDVLADRVQRCVVPRRPAALDRECGAAVDDLQQRARQGVDRARGSQAQASECLTRMAGGLLCPSSSCSRSSTPGALRGSRPRGKRARKCERGSTLLAGLMTEGHLLQDTTGALFRSPQTHPFASHTLLPRTAASHNRSTCSRPARPASTLPAVHLQRSRAPAQSSCRRRRRQCTPVDPALENEARTQPTSAATASGELDTSPPMQAEHTMSTWSTTAPNTV